MNTIFVKKDLPPEELLHVLAHEIVHSMEHQVSGQEEETRVDCIASWFIKLAQITRPEELLTNE